MIHSIKIIVPRNSISNETKEYEIIFKWNFTKYIDDAVKLNTYLLFFIIVLMLASFTDMELECHSIAF